MEYYKKSGRTFVVPAGHFLYGFTIIQISFLFHKPVIYLYEHGFQPSPCPDVLRLLFQIHCIVHLIVYTDLGSPHNDLYALR